MKGTYDFQVHVITQKSLSQSTDKGHLLVLPYYSWDETLKELNKVLSNCADVSWEGMFRQISKHYGWEYEWTHR
ncbi:hypothetical protein SHLO109777_02965 [Shewanella loihica]